MQQLGIISKKKLNDILRETELMIAWFTSSRSVLVHGL